MQQYLRGSEQGNWIEQKQEWQNHDVTFDTFEDLITIVKKRFLNDFKYIDMCFQYYFLIFSGCHDNNTISSLKNEMTMCKNNCNVHVKIHFNNSGEKNMDLQSISNFDGLSCLTMVKKYLPTITTEIERKYPGQSIFFFIPVAVMSKFHQSKDKLESYDDNTSCSQDVKDQADIIWSELKKQYYEFFMDFIHSCELNHTALLRNTCPVFVRRGNPFIVH